MKLLDEPFWTTSYVRVPWPELLEKIKVKLKQLQDTKCKTAGFVWDHTADTAGCQLRRTTTPTKPPVSSAPSAERSNSLKGLVSAWRRSSKSDVAVSPGLQAVLRDVQKSERLAMCSARARGAAMH